MNDIRKILESIDNIDPKVDIENVFLGGDLKGNIEKDTPTEEEIYDALAEYIHSPTDEAKSNLIPILKQLMKFKHLYPDDLFSDSMTGYVYRGRRASFETEQTINHALDVGQKYNKHEFNDYPQEEDFFPYVYHPQYEIQSWSTELDVAVNFGSVSREDSVMTSKYGIIMRTPLDNSFILTSTLCNDIGENNEYEVLRVSSQPLKCELAIIETGY